MTGETDASAWAPLFAPHRATIAPLWAQSPACDTKYSETGYGVDSGVSASKGRTLQGRSGQSTLV